MIEITSRIQLDPREIKESFIRASGPGGQNVNKVSSAVELRFDGGSAGVTTSFEKLDRPWTRHRAYDWRSGTFGGDEITVSDSGG